VILDCVLASQAVESFALCLGEWGFVGSQSLPQRVDVALFTAASAAILHCHSDARGVHRDVFRSKYLNVLDFILGSSGAVTSTAWDMVTSTVCLYWSQACEHAERHVRVQGWSPVRSGTSPRRAT